MAAATVIRLSRGSLIIERWATDKKKKKKKMYGLSITVVARAKKK